MPKNTIHFTKAVIHALTASHDGKSVEYCDDKTRGLRVRVTGTGKKSFYVLRKFKGRTERIHLGRFPDTTIAQVKTKAGEVNALMDAGINPNENKRERREELTATDLFNIYFKRHVEPHTKRPDRTQWHFDQYIKKPLGSKKISDISKKMVSAWHTSIGEKNGKPTANRALTVLKAMFNNASNWELWDGLNPTAGVKKFKEKPRERLVTPDELEKIFSALQCEPNKGLRDFFMMLLLTGARKGNVETMAWEDINLEGGIWTIPDTKNGERLNVQLVNSAIAILCSRCVDGEIPNGYVFPGVGSSGHIVEPKKAWNRVLEKSKIKDLRMHDLRHVFGSYLAATGANQFVIRDAMGHKDISSSSRYVQMAGEIIRNCMEKSTGEMTKKAGSLIPKTDVIQLNKVTTEEA
ncbi:MAG: tyrosine-type recombinase/integrase [Gammaproteobacteria bacterium]|nr:tyrosine-type recombinase/integrase [Gammaproteobacteria bacterium]